MIIEYPLEKLNKFSSFDYPLPYVSEKDFLIITTVGEVIYLADHLNKIGALAHVVEVVPDKYVTLELITTTSEYRYHAIMNKTDTSKGQKVPKSINFKYDNPPIMSTNRPRDVWSRAALYRPEDLPDGTTSAAPPKPPIHVGIDVDGLSIPHTKESPRTIDLYPGMTYIQFIKDFKHTYGDMPTTKDFDDNFVFKSCKDLICNICGKKVKEGWIPLE